MRKQWYEKAIKVRAVETSLLRGGLASWGVKNGEMHGDQLPKRHYWPDHETQQAEVSELWVLFYDIELTKAIESLVEEGLL